MWLVCSTSVTADRDQQHGPQSWAPADRKSKWKKLWASWCDSAAAAPPEEEVPDSWHTHLCQLVGNLHHISWRPAHVSLPSMSQETGWVFFFFFLCVRGITRQFFRVADGSQPPATRATETRVSLKVQPEAQHHCYWSSLIGRYRMKRLHIVAASTDHKTSKKNQKQFTTIVVYQCEKMSRLGHATVKILTSVMCRKQYCDMWIP